MTTVNSDSSSEICAQNIAILHLLHQVPIPPLENSIEGISDRWHGYSLPFEEERRLTNVLAFLSSIKDDPRHIPAIAILEGLRPPHLNLLIAVNKQSHDDGKYDLQQIKAGFEGVFVALSQSPRSPHYEDNVLEAIVSMCSARIRCRLRLVKKKQKESMIDFLNTAIESLQQLKPEVLQRFQTVVNLTLVRMKGVTKLLDSWTKYQTADSLKRLILGMQDLWQVGQLHTILKATPKHIKDDSYWTSLVNIVRKVAKYSNAAKTLCGIAGKYPQIYGMTVVPVNLPKEAFDRSVPTEGQLILESTLHRFDASRKQANIDIIYHALPVSKDEAGRLFSEQVSDTLAEARIHAEIQIIFYYELHPTLNPPRIVRSSKKACFLCNTFISMYKKIYTPRCHGRLYPGWRLPQLSAFMGLQTNLNGVLDELIDGSLHTILSSGKKINRPFPNESSSSTLGTSTSTSVIASSKSREKAAEEEQAEEEEKVESQKIPPSDPRLTESCKSESSSEISDNKPGSMNDLVKGSPELPETSSATMSSRQSTASAVAGNSDIDLIEGHEVLQSINHHGSSQLYRAGPLEVYLECPSEPSQSPRSDRSLSDIPVKIRWLLPEELGASHTNNDSNVIDADLLGSGTEVGIKGQDIIYIGARGSVLRIEFCQGP